MHQLVEPGEMELVDDVAEVWLGVPLKDEGRTVGVLALRSFRRASRSWGQTGSPSCAIRGGGGGRRRA